MYTWNMISSHFGAVRQPYTTAMTLVDILLLMSLQLNVGLSRGKYKVQAPSTDGPPEFRRAYRLHVNTVEQLVIHLPLLWLAVPVLGDMHAAFAGLLWFGARALYINDYRRDPKTRIQGFIIGLAINVILVIAIAMGISRSF